MDKDGKMMTSGLVRDKDGRYYSLETSDATYLGMMRYQNGYYNCNGQQVYLEFVQSGPYFGSIINVEQIQKLQQIYGVTDVTVDTTKYVYISELK